MPSCCGEILPWPNKMSSLRFLILLALLLSAGAASAAPLVSLLVADQKAANVEFASAFRKALTRLAPTVEVRETEVFDETSAASPKVIVAVGSQSFLQAIQKSKRAPVVAALLPRYAYERVLQQATGGVATSAVFLDQPEDRQLAMLSLLPGPPDTIGIFRSASNVLSLPRLRAGAAKYRLKLREEQVSAEHDLASAIQNMSAHADVILATPDPAIFSPQTIPGILLSAYRSRVPLVGFSPAYTRAGALVSMHSSVVQLAEQTAEMIRLMVAGGSVPAPQVPSDFEVSINRQVARSMGIELPVEGVLAERIRARERGL